MSVLLVLKWISWIDCYPLPEGLIGSVCNKGFFFFWLHITLMLFLGSLYTERKCSYPFDDGNGEVKQGGQESLFLLVMVEALKLKASLTHHLPITSANYKCLGRIFGGQEVFLNWHIFVYLPADSGALLVVGFNNASLLADQMGGCCYLRSCTCLP